MKKYDKKGINAKNIKNYIKRHVKTNKFHKVKL